MLIKIALNGARPKSECKFIPQSLDEIEREVRALYIYGCNVFHIHCYDEFGKESLKPYDVDKLVSTVKNISKDIQLGISSGDWIEPDLEKRKYYIQKWKNLPDFISVNIIEEHSIEIADLLYSKGVKIEAGLNEISAVEKFLKSKIINKCYRILIEPEEEEIKSAIKTVNMIDNILTNQGINIPKLLHGFDSVAWELLREAKKRGYDSRIGMEDTLFLENGTKIQSNLELIKYAKSLV